METPNFDILVQEFNNLNVHISITNLVDLSNPKSVTEAISIKFNKFKNESDYKRYLNDIFLKFKLEVNEAMITINEQDNNKFTLINYLSILKDFRNQFYCCSVNGNKEILTSDYIDYSGDTVCRTGNYKPTDKIKSLVCPFILTQSSVLNKITDFINEKLYGVRNPDISKIDSSKVLAEKKLKAETEEKQIPDNERKIYWLKDNVLFFLIFSVLEEEGFISSNGENRKNNETQLAEMLYNYFYLTTNNKKHDKYTDKAFAQNMKKSSRMQTDKTKNVEKRDKIKQLLADLIIKTDKKS